MLVLPGGWIHALNINIHSILPLMLYKYNGKNHYFMPDIMFHTQVTLVAWTYGKSLNKYMHGHQGIDFKCICRSHLSIASYMTSNFDNI
jgi:hypothetical protein